MKLGVTISTNRLSMPLAAIRRASKRLRRALLFERRGVAAPRIVPRAGSLSRRLFLAVAAMLLPLIAVAGVGVLMFRTTVGALEEFREETVGESAAITKVRELLVLADDAGEASVESDDPAQRVTFLELSKRIDDGFARLETLSTPAERSLADTARAQWESAAAEIADLEAADTGLHGDRLDPFHDEIDEASSLLSDADALNVAQVASEIASLRGRERLQLLGSILTLLVGSALGFLLVRRVYRSISAPLSSLESAATRFGSDDLSHRVDVRGDDELARVGMAFNSMADSLHQSREELHDLALHDPLTGLPNRALFMERAERAIARADRGGRAVSVLYLDLDGFKHVNDAHGHQAGDEILLQVTERLEGALRAEETAARLGGDEFAVLLEEDVEGAARVAERLSNRLMGTYRILPGEVTLGVSIGVATCKDGEALDQVLRRADAAMYVRKGAGRGGVHVFGPDLDAALAGDAAPSRTSGSASPSTVLARTFPRSATSSGSRST